MPGSQRLKPSISIPAARLKPCPDTNQAYCEPESVAYPYARIPANWSETGNRATSLSRTHCERGPVFDIGYDEDASGGPLSAAASPLSLESHSRAARRKGIWLVVLCTLLGAAGQILIKTGANSLAHPGPLSTLIAMFTNPPLFAGYCLYAVMTVLFIFALKDGELSILYPIISLTYVWVAGLSVYYFHDRLNLLKLVGIVTIIGGVAVLGRDAHK